MITVQPTQLEGHGVRLEPLTMAHAAALRTAANQGRKTSMTILLRVAAGSTFLLLLGLFARKTFPWAFVEEPR